MSRLDLLWTIKLQNEKHEVETVSTISRLLLENILPKHVAEIIMKENMSQVKSSILRNHSIINFKSLQSLYHESYDNVVVMFASIPNFKEFYVQSDANNDGLECLRLLNEIIAEFDKLLDKNKFSCVEKIKTIGNTYMAAAGLNPGAEHRMVRLRTTSRRQHFFFSLSRHENDTIRILSLSLNLPLPWLLYSKESIGIASMILNYASACVMDHS